MVVGSERGVSHELIADRIHSGKISSMSSDTTASNCTNFSRLSFELPATSPEEKAVAALRPHRSSDSSFQAIRSKAHLSFRDFSLVRQIGSGDIGRVYLCRLRPSTAEEGRLYAMKVVDREVLALKNKTQRAETERRILRLLDHPFLPTLYAEFEALTFSCVVMEYCPGGDLHSLRHRQPHKRFSLTSARFYAAEVLVALEYLHMLGIIYRDLKPENVLVRSDGHIMLTDFDLSLCSDAIPAVEYPSFSPDPATPTSHSRPGPLAPFSCIPARLFQSRKVQSLACAGDLLFVAEPTAAHSLSFVGTHEYVAPEVAAGGAHGSPVDWWALGVFIYEMVYGRTPFAGANNEATLRNIVGRPLAFPGGGARGLEARTQDLISALLEKDPGRRLGSRRGAADVKAHPYFKELNFALIRSAPPPSLAGVRRRVAAADGREAGLFGVF